MAPASSAAAPNTTGDRMPVAGRRLPDDPPAPGGGAAAAAHPANPVGRRGARLASCVGMAPVDSAG
jgi:hypothetical protein